MVPPLSGGPAVPQLHPGKRLRRLRRRADRLQLTDPARAPEVHVLRAVPARTAAAFRAGPALRDRRRVDRPGPRGTRARPGTPGTGTGHGPRRPPAGLHRPLLLRAGQPDRAPPPLLRTA